MLSNADRSCVFFCSARKGVFKEINPVCKLFFSSSTSSCRFRLHRSLKIVHMNQSSLISTCASAYTCNAFNRNGRRRNKFFSHIFRSLYSAVVQITFFIHSRFHLKWQKKKMVFSTHTVNMRSKYLITIQINNKTFFCQNDIFLLFLLKFYFCFSICIDFQFGQLGFSSCRSFCVRILILHNEPLNERREKKNPQNEAKTQNCRYQCHQK